MCGIAGIFHYRSPDRTPDRSQLMRMTRAIAHRGPDGEGFFVDGPVGLGHRRLAIVDLSPTGAQPMISDGGRYVLVYNGEFYNHQEFRKHLLGQGHKFRGSSDTETLLRLLETDGEAALPKLAGIFGFALWDKVERELLLVRDHMGVKQVYYHDDGERLVFASEIKALLACDDVPRRADPEAINQYLHFHTPLFERTFLADVKQLKPGQSLRVSEKGLQFRTYWQVSDFQPRWTDPQESVSALHDRLKSVVSEQLMADVPVGAFFSGGIDSCAISSFAKQCGKPPKLFGVHFSEPGVIDERPYQEAAAKALGLELELTTVQPESFANNFAHLIHLQDSPVIGPALIPMYEVCKLAARQVKVCLGGQAADEIFAGYARYGLTQPIRTFQQVIKSRFAGRASGAGGSSEAKVGGNLWKQVLDSRNLRRLAKAAGSLLDWRGRYFENFAIVPEACWKSIIAEPTLVSRSRCRDLFYDFTKRCPAKDPATTALYWDSQTYLPGLFQQDDRMSMGNSLESRVPMADPRLVAFAFTVDFRLKYRNGASKWLLRQAVANDIPESVLNRRKVGFDTPTKPWMQGSQHQFVRDTLLSQAARERGWWDRRELEKLLAQTQHPLWHDIVWKCLCVETWANNTLHASARTAAAA